jgi:hypothetical protein
MILLAGCSQKFGADIQSFDTKEDAEFDSIKTQQAEYLKSYKEYKEIDRYQIKDSNIKVETFKYKKPDGKVGYQTIFRKPDGSYYSVGEGPDKDSFSTNGWTGPTRPATSTEW